jgi:hypothetical protein
VACNLAPPSHAGQRHPMRRLILASTLLIAGCATAPRQPQPPEPQVSPLSNQQLKTVVGLTASQLVGYLGNPALQVREGTSLKLQFRGRSCVLDAYLYPPANGSGPLRVLHADARSRSGTDASQAGCIAALANPG